jgi:hypothetical protein
MALVGIVVEVEKLAKLYTLRLYGERIKKQTDSSSVVSTKTPGCRAKEEIHGLLDIARVSWIFIFL